MLIADVNPEQSYIASIDENLSNWEDSLSVVFPSQVTGVNTRFSRSTPETYRFLFAPTNYMSPMAWKHNISPSIDLDVKRKKVEYKHTTTPGEEFKVLALRPTSSLIGKSMQDILTYLPPPPQLLGRPVCIPFLIKGSQFTCPDSTTCKGFHLASNKIPNTVSKSYGRVKK